MSGWQRAWDRPEDRPAAAREGSPSLSRAARIAAAVSIALLTANCGATVATRAGKTTNKYGVAASPKVIPDGQPIPKGGGRDMVGKPYVVADRTYVPHPGRGYVRDGEASWYGAAFHGRLTANGEVFDKESVAAAHPTLPLPSYVRVTNLTNRRTMIVRVNDRGPYERGRVIDLSERAAQALAFHRAGTTKVRVEYVGRAGLGGSDDRRLLATLRGDGVPSPSQSGPIRLAALDEGQGAPLAFRPAAERLARARSPVPDAAPPDDEAVPAPIVLASRNGAPRAFEPLPEQSEPVAPPRIVQRGDQAQTAVPETRAPRLVLADRAAPPRAAPAVMAERPAGKGDRLAALASAPAPKADRMAAPAPLARSPDRSLDLATIPGAARPFAAAELPPSRPKLAAVRPEPETAPAPKKTDRLRPANMRTASDVNSAFR